MVMFFNAKASRGMPFHVTVKDVVKLLGYGGCCPSPCRLLGVLWHDSIVCRGSKIKDSWGFGGVLLGHCFD